MTKVISVRIAVEDHNSREYGYGQYVNGYVKDSEFGEMGIYASECLSFHPTEQEIFAASGRVRASARRRYLKDRDS